MLLHLFSNQNTSLLKMELFQTKPPSWQHAKGPRVLLLGANYSCQKQGDRSTRVSKTKHPFPFRLRGVGRSKHNWLSGGDEEVVGGLQKVQFFWFWAGFSYDMHFSLLGILRWWSLLKVLCSGSTKLFQVVPTNHCIAAYLSSEQNFH